MSVGVYTRECVTERVCKESGGKDVLLSVSLEDLNLLLRCGKLVEYVHKD